MRTSKAAFDPPFAGGDQPFGATFIATFIALAFRAAAAQS